ncbi:hypothetical protein Pst134EA_024558 [Puccinia striiformis f. sp. tritici]|uniref:Uncharacterized protein n=1 Tax=Puccinia striiformis f. sp. tritici PST-78 TaxID=1165861 RepID=A0A0L0USW9_9BASI|nr:hypothetical protein Pst134EA_024558 [Puccinia striiformis f. sp. tritici]KAH9444973.1 hypothetical protein Pst134EB_025224 [Puccinia striiformis f. sp. tritici]KAH9453689.1 hypothetical protein Pst134EA_024558 [Puccinia striiformis f. sp. tritici]KNE89996.1 hypothetical protein PSTG_16547 [Puccinia striiformis f. sp. tritici PST-78]
MGSAPFTTARNQRLEPRSQRLRVRQGKHARELRNPPQPLWIYSDNSRIKEYKPLFRLYSCQSKRS